MDLSLPPSSSNISNEIDVLFGKLKDLPPHDSSCLHEEFAIMMADILKSEIPFINSSFDHYNDFQDDSVNHTNCLDILEQRESVAVTNIEKLQSRMVALDEHIQAVEKQLNTHLHRRENIRQETVAEQINLNALQETIKDLTDLENQRLHDFMDVEAKFDFAYGKA
ncbi:hypothetical protein A2U01_0024589, partial [Trifolium medium]|nr:hypothetical protein [Trifolium medium]